MDHCFPTLINGGGPLCTIERLKAKYHEALSNFGFNFNLRRYTEGWMGLDIGPDSVACFQKVGPARYPMPRHTTHFEPWFIDTRPPQPSLSPRVRPGVFGCLDPSQRR